MAVYNPPSESITQFNTLLFNQPEVILSQAEADLLYLSKTKADVSTASSTTFNNAVSVGGNFTTTSIKAATPASSAHTLFDNMTTGGVLTIGNMSASVALKGAVSVGQSGTSGGILTLYRKLNIQDINGNNTGYGEMFYGNGAELVYYSLSVPATLNQTFHRFWNCAAGSTTPILRFEVGDTTKIFNNLEASSRLSFTGATYSFPFASSQSLGYYLTNTGTGQSVTTATQTSILTTSTIPIGVWRCDFSVRNTTGATGGTITAAQSYIATSAASTTPLSFTGALVRAHVAESYVTGDIQVITSSFTLQVTTAQTYSLTILRTFAAGTFTFIGECSFTRLG